MQGVPNIFLKATEQSKTRLQSKRQMLELR